MALETQFDSAGLTRVLAVRLGAMGDIVHTLPAVAALRCALPEAEIGWVVEERWRELLCARGTAGAGPRSPQCPLVDRVHVVDTLQWRKAPFAPQTRREAQAAIKEIRATGYQVAIDFQGAMKSALLMQWSGAPMRLGFARPRERAARLFYTRAVVASGHIVEQNLALAEAVIYSRSPAEKQIPRGLKSRRNDKEEEVFGHGPTEAVPLHAYGALYTLVVGEPWAPLGAEFPLPQDAEAEAWCEGELSRCGFRSFGIITPGGGWGAKCWPAERYGEVARALGADGVRTLVNIGPREEELGRAVEAASGGAAQTIVCSVGQLIALTRRARLLVGGDTGPLHLAAALGVPVVGIYGPTDPARNGPVGSVAAVIRSAVSVTSHKRHLRTEAGLMSITSAEVIATARRLLQEVPA